MASASPLAAEMTEPEGPLSREVIERIDATQLPQLERHHLRLLAHCLACFKTMQPKPSDGSLPRETSRRHWCLEQPRIAEDPEFLDRLLEQLDVAAAALFAAVVAPKNCAMSAPRNAAAGVKRRVDAHDIPLPYMRERPQTQGARRIASHGVRQRQLATQCVKHQMSFKLVRLELLRQCKVRLYSQRQDTFAWLRCMPIIPIKRLKG